MNYCRLPQHLTGIGLLLAGLTVVEVVATVRSPAGFTPAAVANVVTSLPFVVLLLGGGRWLSRTGPPPDRYRRIAAWTVAGGAFFLLFFLVIAVYEVTDWIARLGVLRWAAAVGVGLGTFVGVLEARAIERERAAERSRVRARELERRNERLDEFAGILSHDIRNPLSVAVGNVELLRGEYDDERLDAAASSLDRMAGMVERTLTLARSGQVVGDPERVDLAALVAECWRNVETGRAEIRIADLPVVEADPDRLRHVFENLFRNSVEHGSTGSRPPADDSVEHGSTGSRTQSGDSAEHGGPSVTVSVGSLADGFYVEDDGPGIPADERDAVLDAARSTDRGGIGFGLAIVARIADAHGWDLDVTEGSDGGARFEITGVETERPAAGAGGRPGDRST